MSGSPIPKILTFDTVHSLLNHSELLGLIENALGNYSRREDGGVVQPVRTVVPVENHHGFLGLMPAYSRVDDALAAKIVSFYPENTKLPSHQAWVLYFEPSTGLLKALIDGVSITTVRTALASAIATKHLSSPESSVLAILGSGVQARSHFKALNLIQKFDEVRTWSRTLANAQKFASEIGGKACATAEEAVRDADVIVTVTFASTPIIKKEWIKSGAHINAVGACRPDWQEIDGELMRSSVVYVDSRPACMEEAGDILLSDCDIFAEIGEVINGTKEARWEDTTVFKSVGMAIEDVVAAKMVYERYEMQERHGIALGANGNN